METNATATPTDDDILAQVEEQAKQRAAEAAAAQKAANVAVAKKLMELRAANPDVEVFAAGDSGGTFRGVFRVPSVEIWKRFKSDLKTDAQAAVANQNLCVGCILWPSAEVLSAAVAKRPALYNVLGLALQVKAGAGQEEYVLG